MMFGFNKLYRQHVKLRKFLFKGKTQSSWFLLSLVLLILLPFPISLFPNNKVLIFELSISLVVFFGVQLVSDTFRHFLTGLFLGGLALTFIWMHYLNGHLLLIKILRPIAISAFLIFISYYLMTVLKRSKIIDINMIMIAIAGFLIMGIHGGQLCNLLNLADSSAFNINPEDNSIFTLTYYSFTTLTSLGFGDILPQSAPAQSLSLLIGLSGQLYITILVAILVGKYLMQNHNQV